MMIHVKQAAAIALCIVIFTLVNFVDIDICSSQINPSPGDYESSIFHDGLERTFLYHIPQSYDISTPTPLVIAIHGGGGTGFHMVRLTFGRFNSLSEEEGFIVVYPDGIERHWNDGRKIHYRAHRENIDDTGFMLALIDTFVQELNVDPDCVFATGISNGGMMSFRLACEATDRITAIASVSSALSSELSAHCVPSCPIPTLLITNTEDPLVPWEGGVIRFGRMRLGRAMSASDIAMYWARNNNCSDTPIITELPDNDPTDGTRVRREEFTQCANDTNVVHYIVEGGGHTWPDGYQYLPESLIGVTCKDINACEVIWEFFKGYL
ncbi:phospholipase [bacterium]|nr:phospholipase [bacterium]